MLEVLSALCVGVVFLVVGLINRAQKRTPWMAFLYGGAALLLLATAKLIQMWKP